MKLSEFRQALSAEFGDAYAAVLRRDLVLGSLAGRTAEQAIADGVAPRDVWKALCAATDVPEGRRHGAGRPEPRPDR